MSTYDDEKRGISSFITYLETGGVYMDFDTTEEDEEEEDHVKKDWERCACKEKPSLDEASARYKHQLNLYSVFMKTTNAADFSK